MCILLTPTGALSSTRHHEEQGMMAKNKRASSVIPLGWEVQAVETASLSATVSGLPLPPLC